MRRLVFLDLDDTLFATARKSPAGGGEAVAFGSDGEPRSFMSPGQRGFFDWLAHDAELVPTTGRTLAALRRVRLPFAGRAVCSHGGLVLGADGRPDGRWADHVATEAAACRDALSACVSNARRVIAGAGCDARATAVGEGNGPLYVSVKHNRDDAPALAALASEFKPLLPDGWRLILNDNNLALLPPFLGKERAVAWILDHLPERPAVVVGVGDSLSDGPFLALCDFVVTPARSQLFAALLATGP